MNDYAIKAMVYGVSLFAIVTVITLLMTYYNTAKLVADAANDRMDIVSSLEELENKGDNFSEVTVTGAELRSFIRKYAGDANVNINIVAINGVTAHGYYAINNTTQSYVQTWYNKDIQMIDEAMMSIIDPAGKARIVRRDYGTLVTFAVYLYN